MGNHAQKAERAADYSREIEGIAEGPDYRTEETELAESARFIDGDNDYREAGAGYRDRTGGYHDRTDGYRDYVPGYPGGDYAYRTTGPGYPYRRDDLNFRDYRIAHYARDDRRDEEETIREYRRHLRAARDPYSRQVYNHIIQDEIDHYRSFGDLEQALTRGLTPVTSLAKQISFFLRANRTKGFLFGAGAALLALALTPSLRTGLRTAGSTMMTMAPNQSGYGNQSTNGNQSNQGAGKYNFGGGQNVDSQ